MQTPSVPNNARAPRLSFNELEVGARFMFVGSHIKNERDLLPEVRIAYRVKTGERTYDIHWTAGDVTEGRVGSGDNPVQLVTQDGAR